MMRNDEIREGNLGIIYTIKFNLISKTYVRI